MLLLEGKTDYFARKRLIWQDKNKYNTPKYRLVVRLTNTKVICQIIYAKINGDRVLCCADSSELPQYGVKVGLTNYAAAYCTGLLVARRALKLLNLDTLYVGTEQANGEDYHVESIDGQRAAFRCHLDIGLARTSTGANIFGALKGAVDGGLAIPHSPSRFPGYDNENKSYDQDAHRARIFGAHVGNYMKLLREKSDTDYQRQFSQYIKNNINEENIEAMYSAAHANIRKNPIIEKPEQKKAEPYKGKRYGKVKLDLKQRKRGIRQKMMQYLEHLKRDLVKE